MTKKIKKINKTYNIITTSLAILVVFIVGLLIINNITKVKYDESMRIDSEAIFIDSMAVDNENHLLKTYSEYTDLLSNYKITGRLTESKFDNNDFITYVGGNPCSGIVYPVAINVTENKISIKSVTNGKGACSGGTLFFIPIEKNKLSKLPTVDVN